MASCRCLDGHVEEPYEMSMAWEPEPRSNFFSLPAHLCAVPGITEINPLHSNGEKISDGHHLGSDRLNNIKFWKIKRKNHLFVAKLT